MRYLLALLPLIAACSAADDTPQLPLQDPDADVKACEAVLQEGLDEPENYRRVSAKRQDENITQQAYLDLLPADLRDDVVIIADAERRVRKGLKLRRTTVVGAAKGDDGSPATITEICLFPIVAGRMPEAEELRLTLDEALSAKRRDKMVRYGVVPRDAVDPLPEFTCCL